MDLCGFTLKAISPCVFEPAEEGTVSIQERPVIRHVRLYHRMGRLCS